MFLHTHNSLLEIELKKTIPFTTASKTMIHLGMNLSKEVKDQYTENFKTLMKESEDTNKCKDIPCSWNGIILLKWPNTT